MVFNFQMFDFQHDLSVVSVVILLQLFSVADSSVAVFYSDFLSIVLQDIPGLFFISLFFFHR